MNVMTDEQLQEIEERWEAKLLDVIRYSKVEYDEQHTRIVELEAIIEVTKKTVEMFMPFIKLKTKMLKMGLFDTTSEMWIEHDEMIAALDALDALEGK